MTLADAFARVLVYEGGFTDLPADRGGPTNKGIIQTEYDDYRQSVKALRRSVRFINEDEAKAIYEKNYWSRVRAEWLPDPLAYVMFDTAVLMGSGTAVKFLNQALGLGWQGAIWSVATSARLWKSKPLDLARAVCDQREKRLRAIVDNDASQGTFLKGWLNRLADVRKYVEAAR